MVTHHRKREGKQLFLHTFAFGWGLVFKPTLPFRFTSILNTYLLQLANLLLNKDLLNRLCLRRANFREIFLVHFAKLIPCDWQGSVAFVLCYAAAVLQSLTQSSCTILPINLLYIRAIFQYVSTCQLTDFNH